MSIGPPRIKIIEAESGPIHREDKAAGAPRYRVEFPLIAPFSLAFLKVAQEV